jgi:hypothetical protein
VRSKVGYGVVDEFMTSREALLEDGVNGVNGPIFEARTRNARTREHVITSSTILLKASPFESNSFITSTQCGLPEILSFLTSSDIMIIERQDP